MLNPEYREAFLNEKTGIYNKSDRKRYIIDKMKQDYKIKQQEREKEEEMKLEHQRKEERQLKKA